MRQPGSETTQSLGADMRVSVCRENGSKVPARLRLLTYDACEIVCDHALEPGELVSIELFRMGSIRARVRSAQSGVIEAQFVKECPV